MSAVFSHGRLRLYLLRLLADGPRHGYDLIRLLEDRFHGLYAPSAGTIYPRLARLEAEGLVTHTEAGGRKTYEITSAGRAELAQRADELSRLEAEIHASVADLAALAEEVEAGVRGSVRDLKRELRDARHEARANPRPDSRPDPRDSRREPAGQWHAFSTADHPSSADRPSEAVERAARELAEDVARLVAAGHASAESLRVALSALESMRDQLRHLLR